ncbi:putative membrane protein [Actinobacillus pleuropneumoniae]|nr:Outer membrane lipoprotein pcp [Actinobacillus pleuropneumoniae serovar 2 str. S1536]EFM90819.1 Outer membrane lipoprotein pcp [Actinobacillus pleuropneumoniae serovar 4 str. M62]EFM93028.1 Outer membrane lipoprotein pcp [Actinobacillus pleuropneumoniae serovar 6 str. Femo]EFM95216.1 Outer membrane lipoprotein pcp [Actinobacillus pleuropneumoniae serovar 9 str. CVJ13261]EFM97375.1 Outer membrane lipoprotein pcp [Actinobacillus pleuropneumoniae serovar 10 str. D13039]EFM99553.1 Outer membran
MEKKNMKKFSLAAALFTSLTLVGCANTDIYSGSVYNSSQAKEARSISYGTIVSVRDVKIQADNQGVLGTLGGGALGGITGSTIGGGSGRAVATAVGAIAGAVIGSTIEEKVSQVSSLEMVIRKDDGKEIVVVQKKEDGFVPGKRVRIVGSNSDLNVSVL